MKTKGKDPCSDRLNVRLQVVGERFVTDHGEKRFESNGRKRREANFQKLAGWEEAQVQKNLEELQRTGTQNTPVQGFESYRAQNTLVVIAGNSRLVNWSDTSRQ